MVRLTNKYQSHKIHGHKKVHLSVRPTVAASAGTKQPMWERKTIKATCKKIKSLLCEHRAPRIKNRTSFSSYTLDCMSRNKYPQNCSMETENFIFGL